MSEQLLEALMQLFALLTDVKHTHNSGRAKVEEYLSRQFNAQYVAMFLKRYDYYLAQYNSSAGNHNPISDQTTLNLRRLKTICDQINREVDLDSKILILSSLLNYVYKHEISFLEENFIDTLADNLKIPACDYWALKYFTLGNPLNVVDKDQLLIIDGTALKPHPDVKHVYNKGQAVTIWALHIRATNALFFKYYGDRNLYLNGHAIEVDRVFALKPGTVLNTSVFHPIYYGHVAEKFINTPDQGRIVYRARDIEYKFSDGTTAIHKFSFIGKSGQLVGIMGGSGTGKSTLINVMNGNYKLSSGQISINGYDLERDRRQLRGVIGYVPQDDILNEELTVYENLYFNARLIFSNKTRRERNKLVEKALQEFDLVEARDLKVGNPLNKILSGGQRKRLNIALELMREPSILFVDEPTSGLSSIDSEKVMQLLKRQVLKGKLVIINIHQPGSDLYKLLDKLLVIDTGGRIIYNGNPMNAIVYFKKKANYVNPEERECFLCGNVKTEQPLHIIEARMVDTSGKLIRKRKTSPEEWYDAYYEEFEKSFEWKEKKSFPKEKLPENLYSIPSRWNQFKTYAYRDMLKKIKDTQYFLINLLEVPVLAALLAFATKYAGRASEGGGGYVLANNSNIPTYLFMCVVVSIFVGLNLSAEEIIKDRQLLMREKFLNLSRSAYLNSKIMNLMLIAAFQSFMLVLIGNTILEIEDMLWGYWAILFSTFAYAIIFGLNISSGLKTAVSIYISIPLVIVPQLLFSGTMVNFDKLHENISNRQYVPVIGDLMLSRWSYEALAVHQFKNNDYEEAFFDAERKRAAASYVFSAWIPELHNITNDCRAMLKQEIEQEKIDAEWNLMYSELQKLVTKTKAKVKLPKNECNVMNLDVVDDILDTLKNRHMRYFDISNHKIDTINMHLLERLGSANAVAEFRKRNTNNALSDLTLGKYDYTQIAVYNDMMIRRKQPVYNYPEHPFGRAHFYAPVKKILSWYIETPIFNCVIIWLGAIFFYITLYFDVLRKILAYNERFRKRRLQEELQKLRG